MSQDKTQIGKPATKGIAVAFGLRLRQMRREAKMTQIRANLDYGFQSPLTLSRVETASLGSLSFGQLDRLGRLAADCGRSIQWLLTGEDVAVGEINIPADAAEHLTININLQPTEKSQ